MSLPVCHMLLSICCSRTYYANATCQTLTRKFFFTFSSNYLYSETFENCTYFLYVYKWYIVPKRLTLVSNAKRKISKSNKSKLWNRLSYRDLPYFFEVGSQTFTNDYKILRSQPQNSTAIVFWPQWPQKRRTQKFENSLKSSKYWWEVWILGRGLEKNQMSSTVRSVLEELKTLNCFLLRFPDL